MKIVYITMGRYGMFCTSDAESVDQASEDLKEALVDLGLDVKVNTVEGTSDSKPYAYASKRHDSLSFLYSDDDEPNYFPDPIQLNVPGVNGSLNIDCGVGVLLASTGWGKTTYMVKGLYPSIVDGYGESDIDLISFAEPFENFGVVKTKIVFRAIDLIKQMCRFINSDSDVLMIDSFRPFLYDQSVGTTGERGIDAFLPVQLTALSNILAVCGKLLFVTLNPMIDATTDKEMERYERLQGSIEASVPFVLTGTSKRAATLSLRGFHNPNRDPNFITIPDLSDALVNFNANGQKQGVEMQVTLTPDDSPAPTPATDIKRFMNTIRN